MLSITGKVSLDGRGWEAGIRQVEKSTIRFGTNTLGALKSQIAGAFAVGAITALVKSTIAYGSHLKDTATRLEISTDAVQQFSFAAKQSGSDLDAVAKGLETLRAAAEAAQEGGAAGAKALANFERFGISLADIRTKDPEDLFRQMAQALETMNLAGANGAAVLELLGKKAGGKLIPVMKELRELSKQAPIISKAEIENLDRAGDAIDKLAVKMKVLASKGILGAGELLSNSPIEIMARIMEQNTGPEFQKNEVAGALAAGSIAAIIKQRKDREAAIEAERAAKEKADEDAAAAASVRHQNEQDEIIKLDKETADKTAKSAFAALSADEKRVALAKELKAINDQINSGQAAPGTLLRAQLNNRIAEITDQSAGIKDARVPTGGAGPQSDSLLRVGNFLGTGSSAILSIQQKGLEYQRQIADGIKRLIAISQSQSGTSLSANTP